MRTVILIAGVSSLRLWLEFFNSRVVFFRLRLCLDEYWVSCACVRVLSVVLRSVCLCFCACRFVVFVLD